MAAGVYLTISSLKESDLKKISKFKYFNLNFCD